MGWDEEGAGGFGADFLLRVSVCGRGEARDIGARDDSLEWLWITAVVLFFFSIDCTWRAVSRLNIIVSGAALCAFSWATEFGW